MGDLEVILYVFDDFETFGLTDCVCMSPAGARSVLHHPQGPIPHFPEILSGVGTAPSIYIY